MGTKDKRVDAYIAKAPPFAKPILQYIRTSMHEAVPEVEETLKWSVPAFDYNGIFASMAAFKEHCRFGFWNATGLGLETKTGQSYGAIEKISSLDDLPSKREFIALIRKAKKLKDDGVKPVRPKKEARPALPVPPDLAAALKNNRKAAAVFDGFPPSHRREYIEWITQAKREETRATRLETAIEWIAEGKQRNWKYMK